MEKLAYVHIYHNINNKAVIAQYKTFYILFNS